MISQTKKVRSMNFSLCSLFQSYLLYNIFNKCWRCQIMKLEHSFPTFTIHYSFQNNFQHKKPWIRVEFMSFKENLWELDRYKGLQYFPLSTTNANLTLLYNFETFLTFVLSRTVCLKTIYVYWNYFCLDLWKCGRIKKFMCI